MSHTILFFIFFIAFIVFVIIADLLLISRKKQVISTKNALIWSIIWIGLALVFFIFLWLKGDFIHDITNMDKLKDIIETNRHNVSIIENDFTASIKAYNKNLAIEFISGYILEKSLSLDNIFVMLMIFMSFNVKEQYYKKILFWGILGAIIMRFLFIFSLGAIIDEFDWILSIFGLLLFIMGIILLIKKPKDKMTKQEEHFVVKLISRFIKIKNTTTNNFFIKERGKYYITQLFVVLVIIEFSDIIIAVDSIPVIFAVTQDTYIVFFSNVFAVIGLRSLFFLIANVIKLFRYLTYALAVLLIFIGLKIIFNNYLINMGFNTIHSLIVIFLILISGIIFSILIPKKSK